MRTIRLEIELTYDDEIMHCGERDQEAKAWFYHNVLLEPPDRLILHSNDIGDAIGEVNVLSIANAPRQDRSEATYPARGCSASNGG